MHTIQKIDTHKHINTLKANQVADKNFHIMQTIA